ncbi:hypothetical protein VTN49DRAFT_5629 [Thermomyces lanuginosus]|uniref:uncharacterized protein n=1 Tax=Thermomyces lanuginosus TaxID=5541 RepID=UPI0037449621
MGFEIKKKEKKNVRDKDSNLHTLFSVCCDFPPRVPFLQSSIINFILVHILSVLRENMMDKNIIHVSGYYCSFHSTGINPCKTM